MKVLLIDDEHRRVKPLMDYMRLVRKWTVSLALGPKRAVEILANSAGLEFDVVILDIMMDPEGVVDLAASDRGRSTGLLLIDRIRSALPGTPIVIYTARIDIEDMEKDPRVAAVVQKPSTAKALIAAIEMTLGPRRGS